MVLRYRLGDARAVRRGARRARSRCSASCRRDSSRIRTTTRSNISLRAAQGTSFYEMVDDGRSRSPTSSSRTRTSTALLVNAGGRHRRTAAACSMQLTAAREARRRPPRRSRSRLRGRLEPLPGFRAFVTAAAVAADRRPEGQQQLQPDDAEPRHTTSSTRGRPQLEQAIGEVPRSAGRLDRHGDEEPARRSRRSIATRRRPSA